MTQFAVIVFFNCTSTQWLHTYKVNTWNEKTVNYLVTKRRQGSHLFYRIIE